MRTHRVSVVRAIAGLGAALAMQADAGPAPDFVLRDHLGRSWTNELVSFRMSRAQRKAARAGYSLRDSEGRAVAYQQRGAAAEEICFSADVAPWTEQTYRFDSLRASEPPPTDLGIEESPEFIRVANRHTGITVRKVLKGDEGPVAAIRMGAGDWVGSSVFTGLTVRSWTAAIVAQGPVYAEVACRAVCDEGTLAYRIRLQSGESVLTLEEDSEIDALSAAMLLRLSDGFDAAQIFYRRGFQDAGGVTGNVELSPLPVTDGKPAFVLEPWLHWQSRIRQGNWFSLVGAGPDLLTVGALRPDLWVDLNRARASQAYPQLMLTHEGRFLTLTFPLRRGSRRWLIGAHDKAASLAVLQEKNLQRCTIPQQSVIKHGNYPLDVVKDYVFTWRERPGGHPRLLLTAADVAALRAAGAADTHALAASVAAAIRAPMTHHSSESFIRAYLSSGDRVLGAKLGSNALAWVQGSVDALVKQEALVTLGFAPHHQQGIITALGLADAALADEGNFGPGDVGRLKAQAAFLGYTLARPDNWSPERGFAANPNMTTSLRGYEVAVACFIPSHPKAAAWAEEGLAEMRNQIENWSDANGGWLEAPHYAMVSYDQILGSFLMARNAGFSDDVFRPKMRKVMEWFGKTATPPDSRIGGYRHKPPIGNTYLCEPNGEYGIVASVWKRRDPAFASAMQWMFLQNRSYAQPGIGGGYPALAGYRGLLLDTSIPARAPAWGSEVFPETGVVLRNRYPSDRETYLHLIVGNHRAHYDVDSGSITFWGKGRVLADDFGYYGRAPAEDHNLVRSPVAANEGAMKLEAFQPSEMADYVRGRSAGWTREILLVKDAEPLAPTYAVLADSLSAPAPATWQLWCTAAKVTPNVSGAAVEGKEDVDMDVFFAAPSAPDLKTEEKTRRSGSGLYTNWSWGPMDSTQIGLLATVERGAGFLAVLYPRLKTEAAPTFTSIAGGHGVQIRHPAGVDYVFVSRERLAFKDAAVDFEGTVGVAQLRGGKPALFLGAGGRLSGGGETVTSDRQPGEISANVLKGGDVELQKDRRGEGR